MHGPAPVPRPGPPGSLPADIADAVRLLREHQVPRERVMIMPEGMTDAALRERRLALAASNNALAI